MLKDMAYALCLEIEKLPASEQQTKCSILASNLCTEIARAQQSVQPIVLPAVDSDDEPTSNNG